MDVQDILQDELPDYVEKKVHDGSGSHFVTEAQCHMFTDHVFIHNDQDKWSAGLQTV